MIDRPRLRAALDSFTANVLLIVGPPGYGKTTLARQWLATLRIPTAWYQCSEASTDIAALALGIARASENLFPRSGALLESRLRACGPDGTDPASLAELLMSQAVEGSRLLVLDDYHHLMRSGPAEQLVAELVSSNDTRVLICSRRRPSWASARRLVYCEIQEIGRGDLAMTRSEVAEALGISDDAVLGLADNAGGWPAIIGLASRTADAKNYAAHPFPNEIYEFFAAELYEALADPLRKDLHRLAILPASAYSNLEPFFGSRAAETIDELTRLGFLTLNEHAYATNEPPCDLHPLLREFIQQKMNDESRSAVETKAMEIARRLIDLEQWDEAFSVIRRFSLHTLLALLVERALWELLDEGRLSTVDEWLAAANAARLKTPVVDLAQAELLLRRGAWSSAIRLASDAADAFGEDHPLTSRALNCAARAAHFSDRSDLATTLHSQALEVAKRPEDLRQSLWGKFIAENATDRVDEARASLDAYDALEVCDGDDLVRRMTGRLVFASRYGPVEGVAEMATSALSLLCRAKDPLTRTGFLQMLTYAMVLAARYSEAKEMALREIDEAAQHRLEAIGIHALCALATAEIGSKELTGATASLERAEHKLRGVDDVHARMNVAALRMRIALIRRDYEAALRESEQSWSRMPNVGIQGELLGTRALVHVCVGDISTARKLAAEAEGATVHIETQVTARCVRAAALLGEGKAAVAASKEAFECSERTGAYDPFVVAYRSFPEVVVCAAKSDARPRLRRLIARVNDTSIGRDAGLISDEPSLLSPREGEVLELLERGLSNRAIAQSLWISESTAKVHVRHIFEKLNVRTRTEAALKARELSIKPQQQKGQSTRDAGSRN
jgi:LuxR family maltose regulon positive regulatory protein